MIDDGQAAVLVGSWSAAEQEAVSVLLRPEMVAGWIPAIADLEAAITVVRAGKLEPAGAAGSR